MTGGRACLPVPTSETIQPVATHQGIHHCLLLLLPAIVKSTCRRACISWSSCHSSPTRLRCWSLSQQLLKLLLLYCLYNCCYYHCYCHYKVVLVFAVGHSLGGALASLAAFDIRRHCPCLKPMDVSCYTFGAPRVGNHAFARQYDATLPDTWNIINNQVHLSPDAALPSNGNQCADMFSEHGTLDVVNHWCPCADNLYISCMPVICLPLTTSCAFERLGRLSN